MNAPAHDSPWDDALEVAVTAARRAARRIRERTGQLEELRDKGANDFVTATDEAAQDLIVDTLADAVPEDTVLAEEGADLDAQPVIPEGRRWIVDPLDGTTNFIHQVPPYAVSIALQQGDEIVVGVVLDVTRNELFTAVVDHGLQVDGQPAEVSATDAFENAFLATGFPYRRFEHTETYLDVLGTILRESRSVRRQGAAAIDLARLACGRFDGFFETGLQPWDAAAGALLVREGGGCLTDYRNNDGLLPLFEQQVCATNGRVHEALLDRLATMKDVRL